MHTLPECFVAIVQIPTGTRRAMDFDSRKLSANFEKYLKALQN